MKGSHLIWTGETVLRPFHEGIQILKWSAAAEICEVPNLLVSLSSSTIHFWAHENLPVLPGQQVFNSDGLQVERGVSTANK